LLDTCVVSAMARPRPDDGVRHWLSVHIAQCRLAAVSLGEIAYGIERLSPGARRNGLQRWANELAVQFASRMLVTAERIWTTFGRLKASLQAIGHPQEDMDLLVAATATAHGLTLVTRNLRHFKDTGLELVDPWDVRTASSS